MPEEFEGDLTGAEFWGADLRGARFRDVNLSDVTISHAWLVDVVWDDEATQPLVRHGVLLAAIGVDGRRVRQKSHIRLTEEEYRAAVRVLRRVRATGRMVG